MYTENLHHLPKHLKSHNYANTFYRPTDLSTVDHNIITASNKKAN